MTVREQVLRWEADKQPRRTRDALAIEEPLEIRIDTRPFIVTMRTPGHDDELAAGFLFTEGLIRSADDLRLLRKNPRNRSGNSIDVFLAPRVTINFKRLARHGFAFSSCGVCGKESIRAVHRRMKPVRSSVLIDAEVLLQLPE